jgi:hypothetical protein
MSQLHNNMAQKRSSLTYSGIERSFKIEHIPAKKSSPPTLQTIGTASTSISSDASLHSPQNLKSTNQNNSIEVALRDHGSPQAAPTNNHDERNFNVIVLDHSPQLRLSSCKQGKKHKHSQTVPNRLMRSLSQLRNRRQPQTQTRHVQSSSLDEKDNVSTIAVWCEGDESSLGAKSSVNSFLVDVGMPEVENAVNGLSSTFSEAPPPRAVSMSSTDIADSLPSLPRFVLPLRGHKVRAQRLHLGFARTITMDGILESIDREIRSETANIYTPSRNGVYSQYDVTVGSSSVSTAPINYRQVLKDESPRKRRETNPKQHRRSSSPSWDAQSAVLIWV